MSKEETVTLAKLAQFQPDPCNANKGTPRGRGLLEKSLQELGAGRSIVVDKNNVTIGGAKTLETAVECGLEDAIVVQTDGTKLVVVQRTDLDMATDEKAKLLAIADNRVGELSLDWDVEVLADLNQEIDLSGFFSDEELSNLIESVTNDPPMSAEDEEEAAADLIEKAESGAIESRVSLGQVWRLGRHYIACADSTDEENVKVLMRIAGVDAIDMVWADPPYGYKYQSNMRVKSKKFDMLANDDTILDSFINPVSTLTNGWVLVCTSWKVVEKWIETCSILGDLQNIIVWDKGGGGMGDLTHSLLTDYELILAYNRGEEIKGKRIGSVWSIGKDRPDSYRHPTQKPVELVRQAYECFSIACSQIFDPFLGSGTSILAAQQMEGDRTVLGFELSPEYCEVICRRFEHLTGVNAELVGSL